MRKSTKIFLLIGSLPLFVGVFGTLSGFLFMSLGCTNDFCKSLVFTHWFILMWIPALLVTSICSVVYNFIYDKLESKNNNPVSAGSSITTEATTISKNIIVTLTILGFIIFSLFIIYGKVQDNASAKNMHELEMKQASCIKQAQLLSKNNCNNENTTRENRRNCARADVFENGAWVAYYADTVLYEDCLKK